MKPKLRKGRWSRERKGEPAFPRKGRWARRGDNNPKCPDCDSDDTFKKGFEVVKPGTKKQRYKCKACGRTFYPTEAEAQ